MQPSVPSIKIYCIAERAILNNLKSTIMGKKNLKKTVIGLSYIVFGSQLPAKRSPLIGQPQSHDHSLVRVGQRRMQ